MRLRDKIPFAFGALLGFAFFAIGLAVALLLTPVDDRDAIQNNVIKSQAEYDAQPTGAQVVVFGTLDRNDLVEPMFNAVAFSRQRLEIDEDDEGNDEYVWRTIDKRIPTLNILLGNGEVRTLPVERPGVSIRGSVFTLEEPLPGNYLYGDQRIGEGSTRRQVVTDGELVTVVGEKAADGRIAVSQFYVGDPDGLLRELNQEIQGLRIFGLVFGGVGLVISIAMSVAFFAGQRSSSANDPFDNSDY